MRQNDTIAAISTALSPGGIGIVRISGERAIEIGDAVFEARSGRKLADCKSHTIHFGYALNEKGERLDTVLTAIMRAPRSYTGEDTVEVNCHGGILVLQSVLAAAIAAGANLAEPGEFTKRAFLNGKMDLVQAEAVIDVIEAEGNAALKAGERQLQGDLSERIRQLREELRYEIAYIEAALDDPEHYDLTGYPEELQKKTEKVKERIDSLIRRADSGIRLRSGIRTVILGRPNAGKSSIYNLLTRSNSAIVTEIAGTTRDTLTEHIRLSDVSIQLTDTAGLRESDDLVEKIGVDRARAAAEDADLILCVIDGSHPLEDEDYDLLNYVNRKQTIILFNKSDLFRGEEADPEEIRRICSAPVIIFSAAEGTGLQELEDTIKNMFYRGVFEHTDEVLFTSMRHKQALQAASRSLENVLDSIRQEMPEDFFSIDLTAAYEALGTILGETVGDEIIDEIFSRFCMGK